MGGCTLWWATSSILARKRRCGGMIRACVLCEKKTVSLGVKKSVWACGIAHRMPRTCIGESTSINAGVCCTLDDNDDDNCTARDSCALLAVVSPCSSRPAASPTRARLAGDVPA